MKMINIVPLKSVGSVGFGMTRVQVRSAWGDFKEFRKTKFSKYSTDDFGFVHVFYDENDQCIAVEVFMEDETKVSVDGKIFSNKEFAILKSVISDFHTDDDCNFISPEFSLGVSLAEGVIVSITCGKKDYYKNA